MPSIPQDSVEYDGDWTFLKPKKITCRIVTCQHYNTCMEVGQPKKEIILHNFGLDWQLPGHGHEYSDCGEWRYRGCLNVEGHKQNELFEQAAGKKYVEWYHRNCGRAECPVCYERWAALEAKKMEVRLLSFSRYGKISHVSVSPPDEDIKKLDFETLRAKSYKIAKLRGLKGGSVIWHPWRENEDGKTWRVSPHFHFLAFGWIDFKKVVELEEKDGWVVHYIGDGKRERSIAATAFYQLSHCGIKEGKNPVSYWGVCGNNMAKKNGIVIKKLEKEKHLCPCCGKELIQLQYLGNPDLLPDKDESMCTWTDLEGFYPFEKGTRWKER